MDREDALPAFIDAIDKASNSDLIALCAHNQAMVLNLIDEIKNDPGSLNTSEVLGSALADILVIFAIMEKHMRNCK